METIVFGFSRPKTWKPFSWLIMTSYGIPYSHCYIKIYSSTYNRWLIYQASSTMVNFMNIQTFEEEGLIVHETQITITPETRSKVLQFAIDNCGKPYGIKEIFGLAWVKINEWCGKEIQNPLADEDRSLVCSELASLVLRDCLNIKLPKDPDDMTPLDVYNLLLTISPNYIVDNNT